MGAVKNAVQRDQQDPTIMDLDPEKSFESQRPPEEEDIDPAFEKYFKMLKVVRLRIYSDSFYVGFILTSYSPLLSSCRVFRWVL